MAKFWNNPRFEALNRKWNERLKDSGFKDAEKGTVEERRLKTAAMDPFYKKSRRGREALCISQLKMDTDLLYIEALLEGIRTEPHFTDEFDRLIMEKTAECRSIKEISDELKSLLPKGRQRSKHNRHTIRYIRRRYEHKWGIRYWRPDQMMPKKAPIR